MLCFCAQARHILYRPTLVCSTLSSLSPTCISYFIDAYEIPLDISLAYMKCRLFFEYFISLYEVSLRVFYAPARRYFIGPGEMSSWPSLSLFLFLTPPGYLIDSDEISVFADCSRSFPLLASFLSHTYRRALSLLSLGSATMEKCQPFCLAQHHLSETRHILYVKVCRMVQCFF